MGKEEGGRDGKDIRVSERKGGRNVCTTLRCWRMMGKDIHRH